MHTQVDLDDARYTTRQAAAVLALPFASMDSFLRQLGFEPTVASRGSGKPRRWSLADIVALRIGRCWLRRGVPWIRVRKAIQWIAEGLERIGECPIVVMQGESVWVTQPGSLEEVADERNALTCCDLKSCVAELRRRLECVEADGFTPREHLRTAAGGLALSAGRAGTSGDWPQSGMAEAWRSIPCCLAETADA